MGLIYSHLPGANLYLQLQCRFTNNSQENKIVGEASSCAGMSLDDATS